MQPNIFRLYSYNTNSLYGDNTPHVFIPPGSINLGTTVVWVSLNPTQRNVYPNRKCDPLIADI